MTLTPPLPPPGTCPFSGRAPTLISTCFQDFLVEIISHTTELLPFLPC